MQMAFVNPCERVIETPQRIITHGLRTTVFGKTWMDSEGDLQSSDWVASEIAS